jgi:two-component sensor histidine kinase
MGIELDSSSWRQKLLTYCLRLAVVVGLVALIPSVIISLSSRTFAVLWIDVVAYGAVVVLSFASRIPYTVRAAGFVATLMAVGAALLSTLGPWGAGIAWTFASMQFAALLLGRTGFIVSAAVVALSSGAMGFLLHAGTVDWPISPGEWAVHMINVLASSVGLALATDYLVGKIESSLMRQQHFLHVLRRNHGRLRTHAARQDELVRELHHRVKNNLQLVVSLLNLEDETDSLAAYRSRVNCLALAHELAHGENADAVVPGEELLREVRDQLATGERRDGAYRWCVVEPTEVSVEPGSAGPIALLVNELLKAWLEVHGCESQAGSVRLELNRSGTALVLTVIAHTIEARGDAFVDRVAGRGSDLIEALVGQLRGSLSVQQNGEAVSVLVVVPNVTPRSRPEPPERIA